MARNFMLMRQEIWARGQLKIQIPLMREEKQLVSSRSVTMHVMWNSPISNTTRDSAALLPDVFTSGEEKEQAKF
jgi:hypothetical protein